MHLSKTQQLLSTELVIYPPHCHETLETNMAQNGFIETTKSEKKFFEPTAPPNSPKK